MRRLWCTVLAVLLSATPVKSSNLPDTSVSRILLIYSYHPTFPTSPKVLAGLLAGFGESPPVIEIEYMDSKRFYDDTSLALFRQGISHKLQHRDPYDIVITVDDNALHFVLKHKEKLLPNIPLVFLGLNNRQLAEELSTDPMITGVVEAASIDENIKLIQSLRPEMQQLHIIFDGLTSGLSDLRTTMSLQDQFPLLPFHVISLPELSWNEFKATLAEVPKKDALLLLSAYRDSHGKSISFESSLNLIKDSSVAPVFHPYEHGMGGGILGGVVISHREQGLQAGLMAKKILTGAPVRTIPILSKSPNIPLFDKRQLDLLDIPIAMLPSDSDVRFDQESIFLYYWRETAVVTIIMALMVLIVIVLARSNRARLVISRSLLESESKLRAILDNIDVYIYMKDEQGKYLFANHLMLAQFNISLSEIVSKTDKDLFDKKTAEKIIEVDKQVMQSGRRYKKEESHWLPDFNLYQDVLTTKIPLINEDGDSYALCGISLDITEQKAHEKKLEQIAHYDHLTGLPNRVLFYDRLQLAMKSAVREGTQISLLYLDLDRFKEVNDAYGHMHGDRLLQLITERIQLTILEHDTVARLGGDEFVVLLANTGEPEDDIEITQRILNALTEPMVVDGSILSVTASIGITRYPQADPIEVEHLLRQADQAMYIAKSSGRSRFHFFDSATEKLALRQENLLARVADGLKRQEFKLYYQPKIDLSDGRMIGMEALIRWHHPERGLLAPAAFLPDVERHRLMIDIDEWVIGEALSQLEQWRQVGLSIPVSVNVSYLYFKNKNLAAELQQMLNKYPQLPASLLELEVLETQALENLEEAATVMRECQQLGVNFALDDFGTGFSSLTYLKQLPINILKVDRSFVINMLEDEEDRNILQGILALCQAFNIKAIAEGLETKEHGVQLKAMGYRYAQGYGIAKPMPAEEIVEWFNSWKPPKEWESNGEGLLDMRV